MKSGYPLALLAKLVNGETERFASKGFLKCVQINCVEEPFIKIESVDGIYCANHNNLKMRFLQKWVSTRPACKDSER